MKSYRLIISKDIPNNLALRWLMDTAVKALNLTQVSVEDGTQTNAGEPIILPLSNCFLASPQCQIAKLPATQFSFSKAGSILYNGQEDQLTTAFYLINSIQEYQTENRDELGRFQFSGSYQEKFKAYNYSLVSRLFEDYFRAVYPELLANRRLEKSRFFFSHDIDSLYGAFLQDGLAALKAGRIDIITRLVTNVIFQKPDWFNIDQIAKIDSENDLKSTFFWIVNKGRVSAKLTNADYDINSKKVLTAIETVKENGLNNGLHKSLMNESYQTEMQKLPFHADYNRTHYLRFQLPDHYERIEAAHLKIDASLGFAEQYGFRNSFSIPFVPYNLKENRPFHFLEVPLNLMDGTFQKYMSVSSSSVFDTMCAFVENNAENSVISVLWHNHFFSSYRFSGFKAPYLALIEYVRQKKFEAIDPQELYNKYYFSTE